MDVAQLRGEPGRRLDRQGDEGARGVELERPLDGGPRGAPALQVVSLPGSGQRAALGEDPASVARNGNRVEDVEVHGRADQKGPESEAGCELPPGPSPA